MKVRTIRLLVAVGMSCGIAFAQNAPLVSSHKPMSPPAAAPSASFLVARVNGAGLTQRDLQREMQKQFPYAATHGGRIPGEFSADVRRNALNQILFEEMAYQETKRRKMTAPASLLSDLLRQARARFPNKSAYEAYANQEYGSVKDFEKQIRRGLLIAMLLDLEITQKARVTDAALRQFYAANKKRFLKPASITLQSISFNIPEKAMPAQRAQARQRAETILPQARAAKNYEEFGALAEKVSEDDWRVMMGDHKWIHRGRMPAAVEDIAFRLKAGATSGTIETSEAYVIVRVNGVQPQTQLAYSEVRKSLRENLEKANLEDRRKRFEAQLRKTFKVEEL